VARLDGSTACTAVMGTGIVSVDLHAAGWAFGSVALGLGAGALWLAVLAAGELIGPLSAVPATAVLGVRIVAQGWTAVAWPVLVVAAALLAAQVPRASLPARTRGSDLLTVVAPQSVAVLAATLASAVQARWLAVAALVLVVGGLFIYVAAIRRFDWASVLHGDGDQWIGGGALAISGVAALDVSRSIGGGAWHAVSLVVAFVALLWLPALVAGELLELRLGRPGKRWSTVFPVGMYAALVTAIATSEHVRLTDALTWAAAAVWLLVTVLNVQRTGSGNRRVV
jgi:hypothetical protein